ncbi:uncharacterized protein EDB93DRAFT_1166399 [Suillus bovinus]|uniref:uncharacterized protein n=1 Tax=Suillus bovinus TaxID=48563 RepID=UPI001B85ED15|nr:uncharacterized protein EDB93DRAFT_1166399 [Suillus bovinus]KAG2137866.1 hypothetical protein EDB93DRAFT_1166399 [Suillus bovinus]
MTMHHALLVSEILLDIFAHVNTILDPSSYGEISVARKSLATLATTCRTFHEPAMDLLWADMHGIVPLLGCVTRLHPMIYHHHAGRYTWYSEGIGPLCEHEVPQFLRHAHRVRSLQIPFDNHFHLLSALPIKTFVFPRLLSLSMAIHPAGYLHLFILPTLRRCSLSLIRPDLKLITAYCATLEDLSIKVSSQSTADELSLLSDSIRMCKRLVTLYCPPLDWAAWKHLSNLPTLLSVAICGEVRCPLDTDNFIFTHFLNITALSFHVTTASYVIAVMRNSAFPSLKEFKMVTRVLPLEDAEQLLHVLSQCQTLQHIDILSRDQRVPEPSDSSLTPITQLLGFTHLRTLQLAFPHCCIRLDNHLLLKAMSSWPHIRSLKLEDPLLRLATITFCGLFTALRQSPHLHTLHLLIDALNIDIDSQAESFQHTSLQTLDVRTSHIVDREAVAYILFTMLPSVESVIHGSSGRHIRYAWQEVNRRLQSLKSSAVLGRCITGAAAGC